MLGDCDAILHVVVFEPSEAKGRLGPFLVGDQRPLNTEERDQLVSVITATETWNWDFVSRRPTVPQHLIQLRLDGQDIVLAFDDTRAKLGFIRDSRVVARDIVPSSLGVVRLRALMSASPAVTESVP